MKLNVYGEALQQCQKERNLKDGAMQKDGTCSEPGGGVHQICRGRILARRGYILGFPFQTDSAYGCFGFCLGFHAPVGARDRRWLQTIDRFPKSRSASKAAWKRPKASAIRTCRQGCVPAPT